jgi:plasmid stabilization system protein ParE
MRVLWAAEARSVLVRLHAHLAPVNRRAAARVIQTLRASGSRLQDFPRHGPRIQDGAPRELRRLVVGDYELRYEIQDVTILILNIWHTREDR